MFHAKVHSNIKSNFSLNLLDLRLASLQENLFCFSIKLLGYTKNKNGYKKN